MILELITPLETQTLSNIGYIQAEGLEGSFAILPKHADYAATLVPSILTIRQNNKETYFGLGDGVLTKEDATVRITSATLITADNLPTLSKKIAEQFKSDDEIARKSHAARALMESSMARLLMEIREAK